MDFIRKLLAEEGSIDTYLKQWTDNFDSRNQLWGGQSSKVYLGLVKKEANEWLYVAIKQIERNEDSFNLWNNEKTYLQQVQHKNIVRLIGDAKCDSFLYLVFELMSGNIETYIKELDWITTLKVIHGIADVLQVLHTSNLVHGSLQLHNILIDNERNPKVANFVSVGEVGGRAFIEHTPGYSSLLGYSSRLIESNEKEDDIFAFGTIILCLLTKRSKNIGELKRCTHISLDISRTKQKESVLHKKLLQSNKTQGEKLISLGLECCSRASNLRPTIQQVCERLQKMQDENPTEQSNK